MFFTAQELIDVLFKACVTLKEEGELSMAHYEFQGTLIQCLEYIDEAFGCKDLGCKTRIVIDIQNEKDEKEV